MIEIYLLFIDNPIIILLKLIIYEFIIFNLILTNF
jgi:hypothetical protein